MSQYTYDIHRHDDQDVHVMVTITPERFAEAKKEAIARLSKDVKIKGFRPGKAPKDQIESALGTQWFNEAIRNLLPDIASEILETEDLNPVTQLEYDIADIPDEGGLKFGFTFTEYPKVKLGDFSKLKVERKMTDVEEKDIQSVLDSLIKSYAPKPEAGAELKDGAEPKLPDLTDELVVTMNLPEVATVTELRKYVTEKLTEIKGREGDKKYTQELVEAAIKASEFNVPAKLLEQQADRLIMDYTRTIENLGIKMEQYLEAQNTNIDAIKEQKREEARVLIGEDLVLNEIVREHNLVPSAEDIEHELSHITDESQRTEYDTPQGRRYILSAIVRQRGLEKLRELATAKSKK